jgi:hypothetical protein
MNYIQDNSFWDTALNETSFWCSRSHSRFFLFEKQINRNNHQIWNCIIKKTKMHIHLKKTYL